MALLWFEGFESGGCAAETWWGGIGTGHGGRSGSYAMYPTSFGQNIGFFKTLPSAENELYIQMAQYLYAGSNGPILRWYKGGTVLGSLYYNSDGYLRFYRGDSATLLATTPNNLYGMYTTHLIEVYVKIHGSTGVCTLRINGVQVLTYTGNTQPGSDTTIDGVRIEQMNSYGGWIDDVVINSASGSTSNTWPSGAKMFFLVPTGAGANTNWTPSTGSNYACVDEKPPVMTDYIKTNANDIEDTYAMGDCPANVDVIYGVKIDALVLKVGAPTPTNIKGVLRISSTDYLSGNMIPAITLNAVQINSPIWESKPRNICCFYRV